jgi:hypothetical protein
VYISVTEPIRKSITRTRRMLFVEGTAGKWFKLGFCAFLAGLVQGGGNFNFEDDFGITSEPVVFVVVAGLALALYLLLLWLSSRGQMMFLDGIVRNRGAVVAPWREFAVEGNRLFGARLLLTLGWFVPAALVGVGALLFDQAEHAPPLWGVLAALGLFALVAIAGLLIAQFFLFEFVIPTMYLRRVPVRAAWRMVREEILPGQVGTIFLFFLMQIVLLVAIGLIALVVVLATCCVAALPYLSSVILLPLYVFMQSYTLFFIEQFGPRWHVFVHDPVGPYCRSCGYDLSGTPANQCSECGTEIPVVQWEWLQQQRDASNP